MRSPDAVLFDIDGTLCTYERTSADLLPLAFEAAGVEPFFDAADYEARYGQFAEESEDVADLRERCFGAIAADRGRDPETGRAVARAYAEERDHSQVRPAPGLYEVLDALEGYRLAAVTNGAPGMQRTKLAALDLDGRFETVVHAGYEAPSKPASEPFEQALDAVDTAPARALYVGNSLSADIAGANRAGLGSVWLADGTEEEPAGERVPDLRVERLRDLLEHLP